MPMKCRGNMVDGERRFIVVNWLRLEQIRASATNTGEEKVAKRRRQLLNTQRQTLVMRIFISFEVSICIVNTKTCTVMWSDGKQSQT